MAMYDKNRCLVPYKNYIEIKDFLFFTSYVMYLTVNVLCLTFFAIYFKGSFQKGVVFIALLLLIIKEFSVNKLTVKSFLHVLIALFLFLMFWKAGRSFVGATFIFIWSARDIEFRKIAKVSCVVLSIIMAVTVFSAYAGIIRNYIYYGSTRVRKYIGFLYSLYPAYIYFNIVALYIYLRQKSLKWLEIIILFAVNCYLFVETVSRAAFFLTCLALIIGIFLKYKSDILDKCRAVPFCMVFSFIFFAAVSIGLTIFYDASISWMSSLNKFMESRFSLGLDSLQEYGISILGRRMTWNGNGLNAYGELSWKVTGSGEYDFVDSLYVSTLQREGLIVFIIFMVVITITMYKLYKKRNYYALAFLSLAALETIFDNTAIYFHYCTFIFMASAVPNAFTVSDKKQSHFEIKHRLNVASYK